MARSNLGEADGGTEQRDGRAGAKGGALRKGQPRDTPASITGAPPHDRGRSVTKIHSGVQRFLHIKGHDLDLRGITNCIPLLVLQCSTLTVWCTDHDMGGAVPITFSKREEYFKTSSSSAAFYLRMANTRHTSPKHTTQR